MQATPRTNFQKDEPSSITVAKASAADDAAKRDINLELAHAELLRKERELEALKSQLLVTQQENEQLRTSLRTIVVAPAADLALDRPPSGPASDTELVAALDAMIFEAIAQSATLAEVAPVEAPPFVEPPALRSPLPSTPPAQPSTPPASRSLPPALPSTPPALRSTPPALPSTPPALPAVLPALPATPTSEPQFAAAAEPAVIAEPPARFDFIESGEPFPVLRNVVLSAGSAEQEPASERRGSTRHPCDIDVEFADESHFFAGLTQDISHGGLFVTTYHLLPVGSELRLRFDLPDGTEIDTLGRVRWVQGSSQSEESRPGIGIEFVDPSPEVLRSIAAFCATRPPLYFDSVAPPGSRP